MLRYLKMRDDQIFVNITWALANSVGECKEIKVHYKSEKVYE